MNDDIPAFEGSMKRTRTDEAHDIRIASCQKRLDSGDDCLAVFHDATRGEVYLYRIDDGELLWYWAASKISRMQASQIAEEQRQRASLPDDALHFERVQTLPKSSFKQPTYSSLHGPMLNESP